MAYHWIKIFENEEDLFGYTPINSFLNFTLKGEKICVTRTEKGVFAFEEKCPHNGALLSKGFFTKNNEIVCPLHRYCFELESGKGTNCGYAITTYPIKIKTNGVFVGIKAKWWEM